MFGELTGSEWIVEGFGLHRGSKGGLCSAYLGVT